jgi:hypothetical protein
MESYNMLGTIQNAPATISSTSNTSCTKQYKIKY